MNPTVELIRAKLVMESAERRALERRIPIKPIVRSIGEYHKSENR